MSKHCASFLFSFNHFLSRMRTIHHTHTRNERKKERKMSRHICQAWPVLISMFRAGGDRIISTIITRPATAYTTGVREQKNRIGRPRDVSGADNLYPPSSTTHRKQSGPSYSAVACPRSSPLALFSAKAICKLRAIMRDSGTLQRDVTAGETRISVIFVI